MTWAPAPPKVAGLEGVLLLGFVRAVLGTVLSGLLLLVPLGLVIEGRAQGARAEAVAVARDVLRVELAAGDLMSEVFPVWGRWPQAQEGLLRDARCLTRPVDLPIAAEAIEDVTARATLCVTDDRSGRRLFAVGLAWEDPAPLRRLVPGLFDLPVLARFAPQAHGVLVRQEIWP